MSQFLKRSPAWLAATALGVSLALAGCASDGGHVAATGGGGADPQGNGDDDTPQTGGPLISTLGTANELTDGLVDSTGNVGNILDGAARSGDDALRGLAAVTVDNNSVVGEGGDPLVGANFLSSNAQDGSLLTATANQGEPNTSNLIGASALGMNVSPGTGTPSIGMNVASPSPVQGSLFTGTVTAPQANPLGGVLNSPLSSTTTPAGGLLGNVVPHGQ